MNQPVRVMLWLVCLTTAVGAQGEGGQVGVEFLPSPYPSLSRTRELLDAADLRVMLTLGFESRPDLAAEGRLAGRQGLVEHRLYIRHGAEGEERVEVAIVTGLVSGYEFVLYGEDPELGRRFAGLVEKSRPPEPQEADLGYEMYRLGHIEADRSLALLKALGYSTTEFTVSGRAREGEDIFELVEDKSNKLPWIIRVVNASKTSLLKPDPTSTRMPAAVHQTQGIEGAPQLGGSHLYNATTGAPEERLFLVYDRRDPEALEKLVNLLQDYIDVPAQQIVIEALVIEINTTSLRDLGVEFSGSKGSVSGSFERSETAGHLGTLLFSRDTFSDFLNFRSRLEALVESGDAEILSSPSVLVLNDRQARIQVGRQIPVSRTEATAIQVSRGVEYFPIGIVLNLRPRINREKTEVTMQIETIISSISPESAAKLEAGASDIAFSPIVDNRLVETYVRVADGTPFIIGGLLSTEQQQDRFGVPLLSGIPLLGRLFSRERLEQDRREVIVVITPHVVPLADNSFSYLIPKDSEIFDRFDYRLFRNAYRVRDDDVWDLRFIRESLVLQKLVTRIERRAREDVMLQRQEPFRTLLAGNIPGEEVLVRRMLRDIVRKLEFYREIDLEKVFFFEASGQGEDFNDRDLINLLSTARSSPERAVLLTYEARSQDGSAVSKPFTYPVAAVRDTVVPGEERALVDFLRQVNPHDPEGIPLKWTIVLASEEDIRHLQQALILKRLLELNSKLPLTLQAFRPGVHVLFPTREDMHNRYHLIDAQVAQLFYETAPNQYYPAFERLFNRTVRQIERELDRIGQ